MTSTKESGKASNKVGLAPAIAIIIVAGLGGFLALRALTAPPHHGAPPASAAAAPEPKPASDIPALPGRRRRGRPGLRGLPHPPLRRQQSVCVLRSAHRGRGEGPRGGQVEREVCAAAVACMRRAACYSDRGDPRGCYCGTAEAGACLGGKGNGPCRAELEDAAESTDAGLVASRWTETQYAIAQAVHEVGCRTGMCRHPCLASFAPDRLAAAAASADLRRRAVLGRTPPHTPGGGANYTARAARR